VIYLSISASAFTESNQGAGAESLGQITEIESEKRGQTGRMSHSRPPGRDAQLWPYIRKV